MKRRSIQFKLFYLALLPGMAAVIGFLLLAVHSTQQIKNRLIGLEDQTVERAAEAAQQAFFDRIQHDLSEADFREELNDYLHDGRERRAFQEELQDELEERRRALGSQAGWVLLVSGGGTLLLLVFLALGGWRLVRQLAEPVRQLSEQMRALGEGNFVRKVEIHSGDELETLGQAFNQMGEALASYVDRTVKVTAEQAAVNQELASARQIRQSLLPSAKEDVPAFLCLELGGGERSELGGFYDFCCCADGSWFFLVGHIDGAWSVATLQLALFLALATHAAGREPDIDCLIGRLAAMVDQESALQSMRLEYLTGRCRADGELEWRRAGIHCEVPAAGGTSDLRTCRYVSSATVSDRPSPDAFFAVRFREEG